MISEDDQFHHPEERTGPRKRGRPPHLPWGYTWTAVFNFFSSFKQVYILVPKGAHARGYALQLKIKHCWKLFLFEILCCVLAWMNEYIVQIISATRLWLISRYSHHTLKKRWKMTAKNGHPYTEWFLSLFLQTNHKHMVKQSLICMQKTSFYTDNITSTLTIVVFSINWSRMFALYVCQMCCILELKTLNNQKMTASLRNHWKRCMCSDPCICTTQRCSFFFQRSFAWYRKNISLIVWYCCNIWRPNKIPNILYKTNKKAVSFLSTTSGTSRDLSQVPSLFRPHGVSLFANTERCVVVSFSGATSVQSTVVWCRTCTVHFFRSSFRLFSSLPPIWVCEMKVLWKMASSHAEDLKPVFLYLVEYSMKDFITTRQYLVNVMCNCWFRMCTQFHQKLLSYKCMLFVDCLVVLREYFVNWARVTSNFCPESYVRRHVCHTTVVVMWLKTLNFSSLIKPSRC